MYPTAALSNKLSRSPAPLCRRIDDNLRNAGTQPSSGQGKIPSLLIDSSPSLLTSAAVAVVGRSCSVALERLSFTGAKLHELDRVTPVRAESWDMDEILSFAMEFAFQGRVNTPSRPVNYSPRTEHSLSDLCLLALLMARNILPHILKRQRLRQVLHRTKGLHLSFVLESQYRCLRSDGFSCAT